MTTEKEREDAAGEAQLIDRRLEAAGFTEAVRMRRSFMAADRSLRKFLTAGGES